MADVETPHQTLHAQVVPSLGLRAALTQRLNSQLPISIDHQVQLETCIVQPTTFMTAAQPFGTQLCMLLPFSVRCHPLGQGVLQVSHARHASMELQLNEDSGGPPLGPAWGSCMPSECNSCIRVQHCLELW